MDTRCTPRSGLKTAVGLISSLLCIAFLTGFRAPLEGKYEGPGTQVPDVFLTDLDGNRKSISDLSAGWTLLKLGTTWCPRCGDVVRELNAMAPFFERRGIRVVEIYLGEKVSAVQQDVDAQPRHYSPHILLDSGGDAIVLFGLKIIPRLLLVDGDGIVRLDARYSKAAELEQRIEQAMTAQ